MTWLRPLLGGLAALVLAAVATAESLGDKVSLKAQHQEWIQDTLWCGWGDVDVTYQDVRLRCAELELDLKTLHVKASGNVLFDQGQTRLVADHLEFDLKNKVGTMYGASGFFPPSYQFRAKELEKLDATHWRFEDATFTSCDLSNPSPPWTIDFKSAIVEQEGYGHFKSVALRTHNVPVFYSPRLLWPVKRDRAAGFLVPNIGYNDRHGFYLGNAYFWPITRWLDTTTYVDTYSKGFFGLGQELRWAPAEAAKGQILVDTVHDNTAKRWEWKIEGKHRQLFSGGYSLTADVLEMSNLDFFQSFERAFDQNALRSLYSHITLSRSWGPQSFNIVADHRKTFFGAAGAESAVIQDRLPELEYRLRSTRIGTTPFYISLTTLADGFRVDRSATLRGTYGRFDFFPQLSVLTPGLPWLSITPTVGARETYYTSSNSADRSSLVTEPLSRQYATGGLSIVGPSISRVWVKPPRSGPAPAGAAPPAGAVPAAPAAQAPPAVTPTPAPTAAGQAQPVAPTPTPATPAAQSPPAATPTPAPTAAGQAQPAAPTPTPAAPAGQSPPAVTPTPAPTAAGQAQPAAPTPTPATPAGQSPPAVTPTPAPTAAGQAQPVAPTPTPAAPAAQTPPAAPAAPAPGTEQGLKVKHLIEPRIDYTYVSDPGDVSRIPLFDEKDSVLVTNRLKFTLANRLFVKTGPVGSREVATLELSQEYSFSDFLTFAQPGLTPSHRGPYSAWLRLSPAATSSVDVRADIDAVTHNLRGTSLSTSMSAATAMLNLTWYTSYNPVDGTVTSSQAQVFGGLSPKGSPWRLEAQVAYDVHLHKVLQQRFILRWKGSCWSAYAEVRDYRIAPYQTRDYRISIDLTGIGTFLDIRGALGTLAR